MPSKRAHLALLVAPAAWLTLLLFLGARFGEEFSPDSYAYYLLGKNLVDGAGYASEAIRDFYLQPADGHFQASRSFPPLMPLLVGLVDRAIGVGIASGTMVTVLAVLAMFQVHWLLSLKLAGRLAWLFFVALPVFVLANDGPDSFVAEIVAGRAIPLVALLFFLIAILLCREEGHRPRSFVLGLALGALCLVRFDALLFCAAVIIFATMAHRVRPISLLAGLAAVMLPWLLRNAYTFGNPLASDNSITALSTFPSIVQICWFPDGVPTIGTGPRLWAMQRLDYLAVNFKILARLTTPLGLTAGGILTAWLLCSPRAARPAKTFVWLSLLWIATNLVSVSLTPYHNERYFSLSAFLVGLAGLLAIVQLVLLPPEADARVQEPALQVNVLIFAFTAIGGFLLGPDILSSDANGYQFRRQYEAFKEAVPAEARVASGKAEQLAYYSRWRTIYLPLNIPEPNEAFAAWRRKFNVRYAIVPNGSNIANDQRLAPVRHHFGWTLVELSALDKSAPDQSSLQKTRAGTP